MRDLFVFFYLNYIEILFTSNFSLKQTIANSNVLLILIIQFDSIQDYLYRVFYDTIVAKQLYRKLSFCNRFIYCRNLIYFIYGKMWLILYTVWGLGIISSQVFGHLRSFKGWILFSYSFCFVCSNVDNIHNEDQNWRKETRWNGRQCLCDPVWRERRHGWKYTQSSL